MDTKDFGLMTPFRKLPIVRLFVVGLVGFCGDALAQTNQAHRQQLLQSLPRNHSFAQSARAARQGYVPTNTLAFREWALDAMLAQANVLNERWQLALRKPLTSDDVTRFSALPKIDGPEGAITIGDRFTVGFNNGRWTSFQDKTFCWENLDSDIPRQKQLIKQASLITKSTASAIARESLRAVGIDEQKLKVTLPPEVSQYEYEDKDGKNLPLPLFKIQWKAGKEFASLQMEVSGITKKVVAYVNYSALPMPLPTNYFTMLGVSARPEEWGAQFGYDPANTREFQSAARQLATEQMNHLNNVWALNSKKLSTNDLDIFSAKPSTNSFDISMAQFSDRFYLQIQQGRIQLFKDRANSLEGLGADEAKLRELATQTNSLDLKRAEGIAREALHRLGFDETKLQLREPPKVRQVRVSSESGRPLTLPLYDVMWMFPENERWKYGEGSAAVAFQISALTTGVVMYANNSPLAPQLTLSTNSVVRRKSTAILQPTR
jgi:hypothetical protein